MGRCDLVFHRDRTRTFAEKAIWPVIRLKVVLPVMDRKTTLLPKSNTEPSTVTLNWGSYKSSHQILHHPDLWLHQWHNEFRKWQNKSPHLAKPPVSGWPHIFQPDKYTSHAKKKFSFPKLTAIWLLQRFCVHTSDHSQSLHNPSCVTPYSETAFVQLKTINSGLYKTWCESYSDNCRAMQWITFTSNLHSDFLSTPSRKHSALIHTQPAVRLHLQWNLTAIQAITSHS